MYIGDFILKTETRILNLFQFCSLFQHIAHCKPLLDLMASWSLACLKSSMNKSPATLESTTVSQTIQYHTKDWSMKTYYFIHIKQCNQGSIISWLVCKNIGPVKIAHTHTHPVKKLLGRLVWWLPGAESCHSENTNMAATLRPIEMLLLMVGKSG